MTKKRESSDAIWNYPVFLSLEGRTCLVVGGGAVGERKIRELLKNNGEIRIIARDFTPWIEARAAEGKLAVAGGEYDKSSLAGVDIVYAATSDATLNRRIAADARDEGLWCNMASDPELGSFVVPSIVRKGPLSIAISTGGLSPALSKAIRKKLEQDFGAEWEGFIELLGLLRSTFKSKGVQDRTAARVYSEIAEIPVPDLMREGKREEAFSKVEAACAGVLNGAELSIIWDEAWKHCSW